MSLLCSWMSGTTAGAASTDEGIENNRDCSNGFQISANQGSPRIVRSGKTIQIHTESANIFQRDTNHSFPHLQERLNSLETPTKVSMQTLHATINAPFAATSLAALLAPRHYFTPVSLLVPLAAKSPSSHTRAHLRQPCCH